MCDREERFCYGLFAVGICFAVSVAVGFPLYFGGYEAKETLNRNLVSTNCTVLSHNIVNGTEVRNGRLSSNTVTGSRLYYDVSVAPPFDAMFQNPFNTTLQYGSFTTETNLQKLQTILDVNKPIGSVYQCFYSKKNPTDVQSSKYYNQDYLIAAVFFFTTMVVALVIMMILLFWCCRSTKDCNNINLKAMS